MRIKGFKGILLSTLVILSLMTVALSLLSVGPAVAEGGLTTRVTIYIEGNDDFTPANGVVSGSGTVGDPYIIENWVISAENAHGIRVENTTAYFIIRNCYIHDGKENEQAGVWFENVINGEVDNVKSNNNFHGIFVVLSSNNIILNCTVRNNDYGIVLAASSNSTIKNCVVSKNRRGITVPSANNIILDCTVEGSEWGIIFATLSIGDDDHLYKSTRNTVRNCVISNNTCGIRLLNDSKNNHIYHNNFENNTTGTCLYHPSENNYIYHNNFIKSPAFDNSSNFWDNGYPSGGNYWSDYTGVDVDGDGIGDTPYSIPGGTNQDRYPLGYFAVPEPTNWPLIAGIVGIIAIISIGLVFYLKRR